MATEGLALPSGSAVGQDGTSRAEARACFSPSPLALGLWLAVILVLAKAAHWGVPEASFVGIRDYLVDLPVSVHADLVFAAVFAVVARGMLSATRARPRLNRALGRVLLALGAFFCVYAVASVQIFDFLRSPLTYPLLYLAGEMSNMRSSIGSFATPGVVVALALAPLAYVVLVRTTSRWFSGRRASVVRQLALGVGLAALVVWARATLEGQWGGRADHLIALNPHWEFLSSLAIEGFGASGPRLGVEFPSAYLTDFQPAPRSTFTFAESRRPRNVIVVVLESTGARYLSLYGSPYPTTPNLEREAAHARVFDRFYAHVGLTANSEAAMTLSVYPYMTWREYTVEYPQFPGEALGEILRPRGYRTAFLHSGHLEYVGQERFLQNRGFDELLDWNDLGDGPGHFSWGGSDRVLVDRTLEWIDRDRERPFYAVVWTQQSHHPYEPAPGQEDFDFFGKGPLPPDDWDLGRYLNTIRDADVQLGRLFAGLRERGLADDTLVVITGDHGETFGDPHPTWGHGFRVYEESVRVPMVVWNPRLFPHGGRSDTIGGHVDVNPTVTDLLGFPPSPTWQGRSLFDRSRPPRAYFYAANDDYLLGVREGDWKYVWNATRGRDELYYLLTDPDEKTNVAAQHPDRCLDLRRRVSAWRHHAAQHLTAALAAPAADEPGTSRVTSARP
jgi:arylsulfatase A-like enzyme